MAEVRIAIIGFGKIARDQHLPSISDNPGFRLVAAVAPDGRGPAGVVTFQDHRAMIEGGGIDAVAICTPPGVRYGIARDCLEAGIHVLLEKPPAATVGEIADLATLAAQQGRSLFTAWHSQFSEPVMQARELIGREGLRSLSISWFEDVERRHPGQEWIWAPGGFGVFDAGINALSIATLISPTPLLLQGAEFEMQEKGQQPIAASLKMKSSPQAGPFDARFDWRIKGPERREIDAVTLAGTHLSLKEGGAALELEGQEPVRSSDAEYRLLYKRFAELIQARRSHVDLGPLRLLADAFLLAHRQPPPWVAGKTRTSGRGDGQ